MTENLVKREELLEMFDTAFLPKLHEIAERAKETVEDEVKFFNVQMQLQFDNTNDPLNYDAIESRLLLRMHPVTEKDLEEGGDKDVGDEQRES